MRSMLYTRKVQKLVNKVNVSEIKKGEKENSKGEMRRNDKVIDRVH